MLHTVRSELFGSGLILVYDFIQCCKCDDAIGNTPANKSHLFFFLHHTRFKSVQARPAVPPISPAHSGEEVSPIGQSADKGGM